MSYVWRDVERRARLHRLPFQAPPHWPTDPDQLANRVGIVASSQGWCREYTKASFRAWFEGQPLGADESLRPILRELGKEPQSVIDLADSQEIRELYDRETDAARQLGVFGSPTFAVGREIFWGDDRLEEALAWAREVHPAQHGDQRAN
jgi:2-hydroxychromene-2-carboxylate isomerase